MNNFFNNRQKPANLKKLVILLTLLIAGFGMQAFTSCSSTDEPDLSQGNTSPEWVSCVIGTSCVSISAEDCNSVGTKVETCEASSNGDLPSGQVLCIVNENCIPIPAETCSLLGQEVNACPSGSNEEVLCVIGTSCVPILAETCKTVGTQVTTCPNGSNPGLSSNSVVVSSSSKALSSSSAGAAVSSSSRSTPVSPTTGPVAVYGKLKASGSKIVGSKTGTTAVQVRGVSLGWSNTGWESASFFNAATVNAMVDGWKAEIIRVPMGYSNSKTAGEYGGSYLADKAGNMARVKDAIDAAINKGVYVIIDWHSHDAHSGLSDATEFFTEMAQTYGSYDNVIFEIFNEPLNISWATIKTYATSVISTIRTYSNNLVLVGTPNWDQNVNAPVGDFLDDTNVAYVVHFYAASHALSGYTQGSTTTFQSAVNSVLTAGKPVFVSEYGTVSADGNGTHNTSATETWYTFLDSKSISYCAWHVNNKNETSAFFKSTFNPSTATTASWTTSSNMTNSGNFIYDRLTAWSYSAPWRTGNISNSSSSTVTGNGYEVISNGDFATNSGWYASYGSLTGYTSYQGKIKIVPNGEYGNDLTFYPSGWEEYDYDLQAYQTVEIKKGFSYSLAFGGNVLDGGYYGNNTAKVTFALLSCDATGDCSSYKDWVHSLTADYGDFEKGSWDNCSYNNSSARFVISGGYPNYEDEAFKIAWVFVWAEPISCP